MSGMKDGKRRTWRIAMVGCLAMCGCGAAIHEHLANEVPINTMNSAPTKKPGDAAAIGRLDVRLVAIRRLQDDPERAWTPDGKLYTGWLGNEFWPFERKSDPTKVRLLTFKASNVGKEGLSLCGSVQGGAESDSGEWSAGAEQDGSARFTARAIVDSPGHGSYRLGVASGPWKKVAEVASLPAGAKPAVLAQGDWGKLRMTATTLARPDKPVSSQSLGPPLPPYEFLGFQLDSPDRPRKYAVRVYATTKQGQRWPLYDCGQSMLSQSAPTRETVTGVVVECRPYEYREFTGIPYDPDPKVWDGVHWGHEGDRALPRIGDLVQLVGFSRPEGRGQDLVEQVYAPDGLPWREFPRPKTERLEEVFTDVVKGWKCDQTLRGLVRFGSEFRATGRSAIIDVFESGSGTAGKALGRKLMSFKESNPDVTALRLPDPAAGPYLQFAFRFSEPQWHRVGSMGPVPPDVLRDYDKQVHAFKNGLASSYFQLHITASGQLDWEYAAPQGGKSAKKTGVLRWEGKNRESRLVAVLRSGKRKALCEVFANSWDYRVFAFRRQVESVFAEDNTVVNLADVATFEVETRGFGAPTYLAAKLPARQVGS